MISPSRHFRGRLICNRDIGDGYRFSFERIGTLYQTLHCTICNDSKHALKHMKTFIKPNRFRNCQFLRRSEIVLCYFSSLNPPLRRREKINICIETAKALFDLDKSSSYSLLLYPLGIRPKISRAVPSVLRQQYPLVLCSKTVLLSYLIGVRMQR